MSCWRSTSCAYRFEAGNVHHEHEWKVWQDVKLPDVQVILPGVVSHVTTSRHPELVADSFYVSRNLVGRERVIASTHCGLGGRVHPAYRVVQARRARPGRSTRHSPALALNHPGGRARRNAGRTADEPLVQHVRWVIMAEVTPLPALAAVQPLQGFDTRSVGPDLHVACCAMRTWSPGSNGINGPWCGWHWPTQRHCRVLSHRRAWNLLS